MKEPSEIVRDSLGFGKVEFERSRDFPVPAGRLFSYLADLRNLPAWREEVRKAREVTRRRKKGGLGDSCVLDVDQGGDIPNRADPLVQECCKQDRKSSVLGS